MGVRKLKLPISKIFCMGNMIDSAFYGMIFSSSKDQIATLFEGGYAGFLQGRVVDMFYFPIIENGRFPDWVPIWGGDTFTFFKYVFNIADTAISIGAGIIIVFNKTIFGQEVKKNSSQKA